MLPRPPELARFSSTCFVVGGALAALGLSPLADSWVFAFGVLVGAVGALPHVVAAEERHHAQLLELEPVPDAKDEPARGAPTVEEPIAHELSVEELLARLRPLPELPASTARGSVGWVLVDFRLPATVAAAQVAVVGEFNDWSHTATPMHLEDGAYVARVPLEGGRRYRFRYLLDGERWENDWSADDYVPNVFGGEDSVVAVPSGTTHATATIPSPCGGGKAATVHEPVPTVWEVSR